MDKIWIRTHVSSGDVSVHKNPPRPHMDGMREEKTFNREGEEITTYFDSYGSARFVWIETVLYE